MNHRNRRPRSRPYQGSFGRPNRMPDPVPDCSGILKGPSRHREIIGCEFAHISGATGDHAGSSKRGLGSPRCRAHGRQSEPMDRYHEGTYHCSCAGHSDLGPELRPTRRFRRTLRQLFPGQLQLRQQRVLTTERLRSEACQVSDWSKWAHAAMRPVALVLFSAGSASSIRPSLLPETDPLIHTGAP